MPNASNPISSMFAVCPTAESTTSHSITPSFLPSLDFQLTLQPLPEVSTLSTPVLASTSIPFFLNILVNSLETSLSSRGTNPSIYSTTVTLVPKAA